VLAPSTPAELAQALNEAAAHKRTIALEGNRSKNLMAGPREQADLDSIGLMRARLGGAIA